MAFRYEARDIASLEVDWDALYHSEAGSAFRWDPGDVRIYSTFYLFTFPSVSLRAGTKLPAAPNNYEPDKFLTSGGLSGAGTDMTDFHIQLLVSRRQGPLSVHGNAGLLILGDPAVYSRQVDLVTLSAGTGYALQSWNFLAEFNASIGPEKFDDYRTAGLTMEYGFLKNLSLSLKGVAGLSESTDDFRAVFILKYRK